MAVKYAKAWGCTVTALTTSKGKEEFLKKLGADRVIIVTDEEALKNEVGKYNVLFNAAPTTTSEHFKKYLDLVDTQGFYVQLGAPASTQNVELALSTLPFTEKTICGSQVGPKKVIREMLDFSSKHNIWPLCEQFEFEDCPKAWDTLVNGRPIFRCVVKCKDAFKKE